MDPQPWQIRFYNFIRFKIGGAFTLQSRLNVVPCDFWLFPKLKERLAGRKFTRVQDLSKAVRHFRALRCTCFSIPICSSDVAEAAITLCDHWRGVLWRLVEVWWKYVHRFPFYITCDRTFGLALVKPLVVLLLCSFGFGGLQTRCTILYHIINLCSRGSLWA